MIKVLRLNVGSSSDVVAYASSFEYNATRMGETFVSLEVKSPNPIDFRVGDYVEYRGEKFTLNYLPTVEKISSSRSVGDAFTYKGVKFNGYSDELTRARFLDVVSGDNNIHYSALPKFSFFCATIDNFIERAQANLDRIYPNEWLVSAIKNTPFATNVSIDIDNKNIWEALEMVSSKFKTHFVVRELDGKKQIIIGEENDISDYSLEYGSGNGFISLERIGEDRQQIITRLRAYGSTKNIPAHYYSIPYEAKYAFEKEVAGKHGEPYKVIRENNGNDIRILFPIPFTANGYREVSFYTKDRKLWSFKMTYYERTNLQYRSQGDANWVDYKPQSNRLIETRVSDRDAYGNSYAIYQSQIHISSVANSDNTYNVIPKEQQDSFVSSLNEVLYLEGNLKKDITGVHLIRRYAKYPVAPDNMAVHNLMLPSFLSYEAIDENGNKVYLNPANVDPIEDREQNIVAFYYPKGSKTRYEAVIENNNPKVCLDPYIEDADAVAKYGVREGCKFFDSEGEEDAYSAEIFPTIRGVKARELELAGYSPDLLPDDNGYVDELLIGGVQFYNAEGKVTHSENDTMLPIKDDGVVRDPEAGESNEKPNDTFYVYLKDFGFDLREAVNGENVSIHFTSGMCGEREFELLQQSTNPKKVSVWRKADGSFSAKAIEGAEKVSAWKVALKRSYDEALRTWFPNSLFPISGKPEVRLRPEDAGASSVKHTDSFLLLGFDLPKIFIDAAASRLYEAAKEYLDANSKPKFTYSPKFDPVFMERDMVLKGENSLHHKLRVGTILRFRDNDLKIVNGSSPFLSGSENEHLKLFIDTLSIKTDESGKVSYDIILKEEAEISTIQKIQNQIVALRSGNQAAMTPAKAKALAMSSIQGRYISSENDDVAEGHIEFKKGITSDEEATFEKGTTTKGDAKFESHSTFEKGFTTEDETHFGGDINVGSKVRFGEVYEADNDGNARLKSLKIDEYLEVPELRYNRTSVHIGYELQSPAAGVIDRVERLNDVSGKVYLKLEEGELGTVEVGDLLTGIFHATAANGGATSDTDDGKLNLTFAGFATIYFKVEAVDENRKWFTYSLRPNTTFHPQRFMTFASRGNTTNKERQSFAIYTRTYTRYLRGVNDWEIRATNVAMQQGDLDGINDSAFPLDNQPQGNGLYADNAYLRGTFLLSTGEDIKTKFQVTEGLIKSSAEAIRQDFVADKSFLNNPSFGDGLEKWLTENETTFWLVGNKWIWANNNVLTKKGDGASVLKDDGRVVVRILNKYITQKNHNLRGIPTMRVRADGLKEPLPVYLSFLYKCKKGGNLNIKFNNVDKAGFEDFDSFDVSEELSPTDGYQQYTCSGLWNGTGEFYLSFTGEIYLYMLILSTDKIESLTYKYRTLFKQSEKLVQIAAQNFDKDGNVLESSGIVTTSNFAGIFSSAVDNDTDIVKKADISTFITKDKNGNIESGVHIGADNISLEGIVTANENFKIKEDGSIEAKNANLSGDLLSSNKRLGHSISVNASSGSLSLSGPVSVMYEDGEHLPSNAKRQDLWKVAFEVDPETNTSVASMYLYGMNQMVNIDPISGILLRPRDFTNNHGCFINKDKITIIGDRGTCHITSSGIVFRNSNGDIIKQI